MPEEKHEEIPQPTEPTPEVAQPSEASGSIPVEDEIPEDKPEDFFPNYDDTALEDIDPEDLELPPSEFEYDDYADYEDDLPLSEDLGEDEEVDLLNDLDRILEEDLIDQVTEDSHEVHEDMKPNEQNVPEAEPAINSQPEVEPEIKPEVEEEDEIERQMREAREKIEALQREKERRSTTPEPATEEIIPEDEPKDDLHDGLQAYEEMAEDPNEVDQREIVEEVAEVPEENLQNFDDFENIHGNAEDWGIEDPEVITEEMLPKGDQEKERAAEEIPNVDLHAEVVQEPPTPAPEDYYEEPEDILDSIPSPTEAPYEDDRLDSAEDVIIHEEPSNQHEDLQDIKNETDDEEEIRRKYQGKNILIRSNATWKRPFL